MIVTATTALAEERAGDGIEVLLSTPLSAREILLGKWWGAYRIVPGIAVIPAVISLGLGITRARLALAALSLGLLPAAVMAYGAMLTSLGLAIATRQRRLGARWRWPCSRT